MDGEHPSSQGPASRAGLELVAVVGDAVMVTPLPARGSVVIGRGEGCDARIENRSVSRRHAVLHLGPPLQIEDLGSVNGTFVRDTRSAVDTLGTHPLRRLSKATVELAVGERVNLGAIVIMVRPERRAEAPSRGAVVCDPAMRALHEQAARAARSAIGVLILGETGVGKEVLARAVHDASPRARKPYLELNCAALPSSLLEGELFGHEKNAFTGASQAKAGLLESADGGTIFLDEVGELPLAVQVKLLRVLEDRKVLRLGGRTPKQLDVRFIAATNRDLEGEIARGTFRQDLYFRLNGVSFVIPPLRARVVEIAPLAERFLAEGCRQLGRAEPLRLSQEARDYLQRYGWPGNVRELRNVIERAVVLCGGEEILPEDLPARVTGVAAGPREAGEARPWAEGDAGRLKPANEPAERRRIIEALEQCAGNQTRAAKLLDLPLRTLVKRLDEYDIPRPRKRS